MNNGNRNESRGVDEVLVLPRTNFKKRERNTAIALAANASPRELFSFMARKQLARRRRIFCCGAFLAILGHSNAWRWVIWRIPAR